MSRLHAWESSLRIPEPFGFSADYYLDLRKAHPEWLAFEQRGDITVRRREDGERYVFIVEDTPAADAVRKAMIEEAEAFPRHDPEDPRPTLRSLREGRDAPA